MGSRRKARECALQMLYQWDLGKDSPETIEQTFWSSSAEPPKKSPAKGRKKRPGANPKSKTKSETDSSPKKEAKLEAPIKTKTDPKKAPPGNQAESLRSFANHLFAGTVEAVEEIDLLIRHHAQHWRLERMAVVDRNILRLGIYEIRHHQETPPVVVINEALEIARKFSAEKSVQFINGLLDHIHKEASGNQPA